MSRRCKKLPLAPPTAPLDALLPAPRRRCARVVDSADRYGAIRRGRCGGACIRADRSATAARDAYRARARRHVAAARGRADPAPAGRVRPQSRRLVRLSQGVSDAGRAGALRQGCTCSGWRISNGRIRGVAARRNGPRHVGALSDVCSTTETHCGRSPWTRRSSRRRAAASARHRWRRIMYSGIKAKYAGDPRDIDSPRQAGVKPMRVFKRKSGAKLVDARFRVCIDARVQRSDRPRPRGADQAARSRIAGCGERETPLLGDPAKISAEVTDAVRAGLHRTPGTDSWKTSSIVSFPTSAQTAEALRIVAVHLAAARSL